MIVNKYISLILLSISLLLTNSLFGQSKKEKELIADKYMLENQYAEASNIYLQLIEEDSNDINVIYKYANSQLRQLNYSCAFKNYSKVIKSKSEETPPNAYFYYAKSAQYLGRYEDAISGYNKYIKNGISSSLRSQSEQLIKSCKFAINSKNDSAKYNILHLPPPINTAYSEFNPVAITDNTLVFSRYESLFNDSNQNVFYETYVSDIFISKQTQQGWQKPKILDDRLSSNKYFTGNICFSKNNRVAYFSRCLNEDGNIGNCEIYKSEIKAGKWKRPKKMSEKINIPNYSATQPFLVEYNDHQILYFSSNRPNGYGGVDIWYALIKNGTIQQVSNLGSIINTTGNEMCPFYDSDEGILYFSSDTHEGFGGHDIFKSIGGLSQWQSVKNLGLPINSPANDLYYSHRNKGETILFSSNRIGSFHHNGLENCCGDIYMGYKTENKFETHPPIEIAKDSTAEDSTTLAIKNLLPLTLYFENDMPDPKSLGTVTKSNYKDLLDDYVTAKDIYKKEYSKGLEGIRQEEAKSQIDSFFTKKVESGYADLQRFANLLKMELDAGKNVRIKIRGYASPLNTKEYNLALSKRRISSLINFIKEYDEGYFIKYMNDNSANGGSLTIYQDPLGDSQSTGLVSDNPNDKRNSVYSRDAALQRKIQIIMYSSDDRNINIEDYPVLQYKYDNINIEKLQKGDNKSFIFHFKNTGKSELHITELSSNCNCLQLQMERAEYQSGEDGKFYILLRTKKLNKGVYSQKIIIKSNAIETEKAIYINFTIQ